MWFTVFTVHGNHQEIPSSKGQVDIGVLLFSHAVDTQ